MKHHRPDISKELLVQPWKRGVKLIKPDEAVSFYPERTVKNILQLPLSVCFMDTESLVQDMSEACAEACGMPSVASYIGKNAFASSSPDYARRVMANDQHVLFSREIKIFEENLLRNDGQYIQYISIKSPWYNQENKLAGVFCCAIALGKQALAESLLNIAKLGLLEAKGFAAKNLLPGLEIEGNYLSGREKECLHFYVRGKSAKETAKALGLSKRTVENYLANIKEKLGVHSKSELIDKTMDYFL